MTDILNSDDLDHTGIVVSHLDAAIAKLTPVAGYRWACACAEGQEPVVSPTTTTRWESGSRSWTGRCSAISTSSSTTIVKERLGHG